MNELELVLASSRCSQVLQAAKELQLCMTEMCQTGSRHSYDRQKSRRSVGPGYMLHQTRQIHWTRRGWRVSERRTFVQVSAISEAMGAVQAVQGVQGVQGVQARGLRVLSRIQKNNSSRSGHRAPQFGDPSSKCHRCGGRTAFIRRALSQCRLTGGQFYAG